VHPTFILAIAVWNGHPPRGQPRLISTAAVGHDSDPARFASS